MLPKSSTSQGNLIRSLDEIFFQGYLTMSHNLIVSAGLQSVSRKPILAGPLLQAYADLQWIFFPNHWSTNEPTPGASNMTAETGKPLPTLNFATALEELWVGTSK